MTTYDVEDYSVSKLGRLLDQHSHEGRGYSQSKSHLSYFDEYLTFIGAKSILIENPYTDRDYLEDYAAYYARCHAEYKRRCVRLHFFNSPIDQDSIDKAIRGDGAAVVQLQSSYLGFIVLYQRP
jgi:hypothetical protein